MSTYEQVKDRLAQERASLEEKAGLLRPEAIEQRRAALDREEALNEKTQADQEAVAARAAADAAQAEFEERSRVEAEWERERQSRRVIYVLNGGDGARFDATWPEERDRLVRQRMNAGSDRVARTRL